MIKYLSLFSGIGSPEQALKNIGIDFELFRFSEIDKYTIKSYCAIHGVDENLNLGDITKIDIDKLPCDIDLITHGSPCQDFSVAGKGRGGDEGTGTRSSLMWNTVAICEHCKPKYVIWENVKNVLAKKNIHNFEKYLDRMESIGYKNYHKVLNAKDFGVPQNRERIFVVSIRADIKKDFVFPIGFDNGIRLKDVLEDEVDEKYYISEDKASKIITEYKGNLSGVKNGISLSNQANVIEKETEIASTLMARDYKRFGNQAMTGVVMPCITPDRLEKRQNGRRFKEDGEPMFTITSQDRHGVLCVDDTQGYDGTRFYNDQVPTLRANRSGLKVVETEKQILRPIRTEYGKAIRKSYESGEIQESRHNMTKLEPRNDGVTNTLTTVQKDNLVLETKKPKRLGGIFDTDKSTHQAGSVWDTEGLAPTLDTMQGGV